MDKLAGMIESALQRYGSKNIRTMLDSEDWRDAAQWARNSMVAEGLLKADSPRGVWEISDKGRDVLRTADG